MCKITWQVDNSVPMTIPPELFEFLLAPQIFLTFSRQAFITSTKTRVLLNIEKKKPITKTTNVL